MVPHEAHARCSKCDHTCLLTGATTIGHVSAYVQVAILRQPAHRSGTSSWSDQIQIQADAHADGIAMTGSSIDSGQRRI